MSLNRLAALVVLLALTACSEQDAQSVTPRSVEFARAVSISTVELRSMARSLAASGLLIPSEEASVGSELSGFVVNEVLVEEGAVVAAGDVLVVLDSESNTTKLIHGHFTRYWIKSSMTAS